MGILSGLLFVFMTLLGYSSGAVIAGWGRRVRPGLLDLAVVALLWSMALGTRSMLNKWIAVPIWLIVAALASALLTEMRRGSYERRKSANSMLMAESPLHRAWNRWKVFATEMGNFQGRVLFAFFYLIFVTPFGIGMRLFGDPLGVKPVKQKSSWVGRTPVSKGLESAKDQF